MFGQVKGHVCVGPPLNIWNDIVVSDLHCLIITYIYFDGQNKPTMSRQDLHHIHLAFAGAQKLVLLLSSLAGKRLTGITTK